MNILICLQFSDFVGVVTFNSFWCSIRSTPFLKRDFSEVWYMTTLHQQLVLDITSQYKPTQPLFPCFFFNNKPAFLNLLNDIIMFSPTPCNNYLSIMEGRFIMYKLRHSFVFWGINDGPLYKTIQALVR